MRTSSSLLAGISRGSQILSKDDAVVGLMKLRAREIGKMTKLTAMEGALFDKRLSMRTCSYIFLNVHHLFGKMSSRYQHVDGSTYEGEWIADRQWEIPASQTQAKALRGKYDRSAAYSVRAMELVLSMARHGARARSFLFRLSRKVVTARWVLCLRCKLRLRVAASVVPDLSIGFSLVPFSLGPHL